MANEKKPSIYADRGTIGSSEELDEYGVWVKGEPQDLSPKDIAAVKIPDSGNVDFEIPEMDDLPDLNVIKSDSPGEPDFGDDFDLSIKGSDDEEDDRDVFNFGDISEQTALEDSAEELPALGEIEDFPESIEIPEEISFEEGSNDFADITMDDSIGIKDMDSGSSQEFPIEIKAESSSVGFSSEKTATPPDLSTQLLMKIADELASIRTELSSLKKEFAGIRVAAKASEDEEAGYFGEEDDEKISLTGDELNNILNTADFTEEAGADATVELSGDLTLEEPQGLTEEDFSPEEFSSEELSPEDLTIDDLSADYLSDPELLKEPDPLEINFDDHDEEEPQAPNLDLLDVEVGLDKTNLDLTDSGSVFSGEDVSIPEEVFPDLSELDTEELSEIREMGVEPLAPAPDADDTDYLTNDPITEDSPLELEEIPFDDLADLSPMDLSSETEVEELDSNNSLDLSEAVIDEPDLSSGIQDNPLVEPSLEDISINLDLSELGSSDTDTPDLDTADLEPMELSSPESDSPFEETELVSPLEEMDLTEAEPVSDELSEDEVLEPLDVGDVASDSFEKFEEPVITEGAFPSETPGFEESVEAPSYTKLKQELKTVLSYMDQLLESLPDDKIEEFARSDYYDTYKKLFKDLGLA